MKTKQHTRLCSNDSIEPYFNTILGHQDMVSVSAELPAIDQTPAVQEEVEVAVPLERDFLYCDFSKFVSKTITKKLEMLISDSAFLAGPEIPWLWIFLGRSTKQPNFENIE